MNMLPAKPEKLTTAHPCLDSQNDKLLQQRRSSPITCREQALFFPIFKTALAPLRDSRASNHLHRVAWQPESPLPKRSLDGVAQRVEFAYHRRGSDIFEPLVAIGCDICA